VNNSIESITDFSSSILNKKYNVNENFNMPNFILNNEFNVENLKEMEKMIEIFKTGELGLFKNDIHLKIYVWYQKHLISKEAIQELLNILEKSNLGLPKEIKDFIKPVVDLKIGKYELYYCKFKHKSAIMDISQIICNIFRNVDKCTHLHFCFKNQTYYQNYYETQNSKKLLEESLLEKFLYLMIDLYSDAFRKGRFSKSALDGNYFSILNYDYNYLVNNIELISLTPNCKECILLKNKIIIAQFENLIKNGIKVFHAGLNMWLPIKVKIPVYSCDSPEESKITYNSSHNAKHFCHRCEVKSSEIEDFSFDVTKNIKSAVEIKKKFDSINTENNEDLNLQGLSFYKKNGLVKESNPYWALLEFDGTDINKIISPDLFHTLFSCIASTLHVIVYESLTSLQKEQCINNSKKIIYLDKMKKLNLDLAGLFDIDDWITYSLVIEFIYFNVVTKEQFEMIKYFSKSCFILLRKKITDNAIDEAEFCYRNFLLILFRLYKKDKWNKKSTIHKVLHFFPFFKENGPGKLTWTKHFEVFHLFFKRRLKISNYINSSESLTKSYISCETLKLLYPHFFEKKMIYFSEEISFLSEFEECQDNYNLDLNFEFQFIYEIDKLKISHKLLQKNSNISFFDNNNQILKYGEIQHIFFIKNDIIIILKDFFLTKNKDTHFFSYYKSDIISIITCLSYVGEIFCFDSKINILWVE
jgi:hypothetical protein